jgi:hypothetical protein
MLKISRARPKGPVSHSSVTGQRSFSFLCCRFRNQTPGPPPFSVDEFGRRGAPSSGNGLIYRRILVSFCKIYYYNVYISFNSTARPLCYRRPPRCDFFWLFVFSRGGGLAKHLLHALCLYEMFDLSRNHRVETLA